MNRHSNCHLVFFMATFWMVSMAIGQEPGNSKILADEEFENLSFAELHEREKEAYKAYNDDLLRALCKVHVARAKRMNDPIELAKGYTYLAAIEKPDLAKRFTDSIIWATQGSDHQEFPTKGYYLRAAIHYDEGRYRKALASYAKAYELALEKENRIDQRDITMNIAAIRNINGQPGIAANLYHRALYLLRQEPDYEREWYPDHMLLLHNLSLAHLRMGQLDSARHYTQLGSERALLSGDAETFRDFVLIGAQTDYFSGRYDRAKDTLLKYVDSLEPEPKAVKWFYLGKIAQHEKRNDRAMAYFTSIDSLLEITEEPFPEIKEVYLQLMADAAANGNQDAQLGYIDKLIRYDSILALEKEGVSDQAVVAYDIPYLRAQRKAVSEALETRKKWLYGLLFLLVASLVAGAFFYVRNRKMTKKVKELTSKPDMDWKPKPEVTDKAQGIPLEVQNRLLRELEAFEASNRCAKPEMDQTELAKQMKTNTTYLSGVVNHYKGMTFPTYLKELRITKAIPRLTHDIGLLKFNYGGLANEFGFRTADSFAKALYQRTGVYPSKFLKELEQRKMNDDL